MKHIIDRILVRGQNGTEEQKEISVKTHEELLDKYVCKHPTVDDLENLFRELNYDSTTNEGFEMWLKINTTFELIKNGNYELVKQ